MSTPSSPNREPLSQVLITTAWLGIATGLLEGCGLLIFQTLNGEDWALHVSAPIIWISVVVDVLLFCLIGLLVAGAARIFQKISATRVAAILMAGLATYDLLTLTARLSSRSRILLAVGVAFAFRRWFIPHEAGAKTFWRRTLPLAAAIAFLVFAGISGTRWFQESRAVAKLPDADKNSPNVLVIVVDTLRADHLSSYGYAQPTSPNIDRLAREGVLFENAVSACSWTYPSHVSLVTGRYLFEHGTGRPERIPLVGVNKSSFGGYPTIGEALEQRGYRTGAFSANRSFFIGNGGFNRGFTHFDDYYNSVPDMFARTLFGKEFLRLYGKFFEKRLTAEWLAYGTNYGIRKRGDAVNDEVLRWIDRGGQHPFFAFLNYYDVHDPYGVPAAYPKFSQGNDSVNLYDDGVHYTDDYIGRLVQGLEQRGLAKNTLVIITSDHGESLGEHGFEGHGRALYWGLIHVPLVVWHPGQVPSRVRISQPVTNVAIPATILQLIDAKNDHFRGPSLSLLWSKPEMAAKWPEPISELAENQRIFKDDESLEARVATAKNGPLKSLITPRWHFIIHKRFGDQLYDWVNDPAEEKNLIATPEGQELSRDLISKMNDALAGSSGPPATVIATLPRGTFHTRRSPAHAKHLNDYYRIQAQAGAKVTIEVVSAKPRSGRPLDPVVSLQDASGQLLKTCRNPGDDKIQTPGIADPTPDAFDDVCINDDVDPGKNHDAMLEILVPGASAPAVDLYLRISDWDGRAPSELDYRIAVSGNDAGTSENSAAKKTR